MQNFSYGKADPLLEKQVKVAIEEGESRLGKDGRLVIQKSGTEPVVRVMAEGDDASLVTEVVDNIVSVMQESLR